MGNSNPHELPAAANIERFSGFADRYDAYRPHPPSAITAILTRIADTRVPSLVADLGSGTGLSSYLWAGRAEAVIGIEPNADMRSQAESGRPPGSGTVRFQDGLSTMTGLRDASADIVTCSQSLHWMDPEPTFREIGRILRPGGVFAAYDCDWPPTIHWEIEQVYQRFISEAAALGERRGCYGGVTHWDKSGHLNRIRSSGEFRYVKEITLHHVESGGAERLVGLALSQGSVATLLKQGLSERDIGLDLFRAEAARLMGSDSCPWYWSYRVRLGVR